MHGSGGEWVPHVIFGLDPLWVSTALLVITFALIISEKVNRAIIALLGAGLMIVTGVLNQRAAVQGIDFNTIALLTGMMVLVAITGKSGVFQFVAIWAAKKVRARPAGILLLLSTVTAVFSALLDNVTTVLLIVPVTLLITEELEVKAYPYLFAEILSSNMGGMATLIGDPPNILIGSAAGLTFNDFLVNMAPISLIIMALFLVGLHLVVGRRLDASAEARARVMSFNEREAITDSVLLKKSIFALSLVLLGFIVGHPLGLEPGTVAMSGAALLLLLHNIRFDAETQSKNVHHAFGEVEWVTIFFFVGLFIVVAGVERAGLLEALADELLAFTGGDLAVTAGVILWSSAILSAILDNIPYVATMIPLIQSMAPQFGGPEAIQPLWWALALGACLGGNGSLIGASANLTVVAFAERAGQSIRFLTFMKLAFPIMIVTIGIAHVYLYMRYL